MAASIKYYKDFFKGKVMMDMDIAGNRNVFMQIGNGRIHLYDRPPHEGRRGAIHHIGIQTDDLDGLVSKMKSRGIEFRKEITDFGFWKYIMTMGPDEVLIEIFEVDKSKAPVEYQAYFE
jgi:hypothetical protein